MKIGVIADVHFRGGEKLPVIARAWSQAYVDIFLPRGVTAVIVAGDLHDDPNLAIGRDSTAGDIQRAVIAPMLIADIDTYVLPGNHDDQGPGHFSALEYLRGLPFVHVIEKPQVIALEDRARSDSGSDVLIGLLPWEWNSVLLTNPEYRAMDEATFGAAVAERCRMKLAGIASQWHSGNEFKLLCGHAEIDGARNRYRELPAGSTHVYSLPDLQATGASALAFGHYHKRQLDAYVGALIQLDRGEEGNPTGVLIIDTATGTKEFVPVECPRYVTINVAAWNDEESHAVRSHAEMMAFAEEQGARLGTDHVIVRAPAPPPEIALGIERWGKGVRFEAIPEATPARTRAEGINAEETLQGMLLRWIEIRDPRKRPFDDVAQQFNRVLAEAPPDAPSADVTGAIHRIVSITLRNIGCHANTHVEFPTTAALIGLVGHTGAGKTTLLEAICLALWDSMPFYDGATVYDLMPPPTSGAVEAMIEVVFDAAAGRFRALRKLKHTAKTQSNKPYLFRIDTTPEIEIAGSGREKELAAEVRQVAGDRQRFLATVFQSQHDAGSLIDADPKDRMAFARRWVGADRFDAPFKFAHARMVDADSAVMLTKMRLKETGEAIQRVAEATEEAKYIAEEADLAARKIGDAQQGIADTETEIEARSTDVQDNRARQVEAQRISVAGKAAVADLAALDAQLAAGESAPRDLAEVHATLARIRSLRSKLTEVNAYIVAGSQTASEVHTLQADKSRVESEMMMARAEYDRQHAVRERELEESLRRAKQVAQEVSGALQREASSLRARLDALRPQTALLEQAGCARARSWVRPDAQGWDEQGAGLMPCAFIDAARKAPDQIAALEGQLAAVLDRVERADFGEEVRVAGEAAQQALAAHMTAKHFDASPWVERIAVVQDLIDAMPPLPNLTAQREEARSISTAIDGQFPNETEDRLRRLERAVVAQEGLQAQRDTLAATVTKLRAELTQIGFSYEALRAAEEALGHLRSRLGNLRASLDHLQREQTTLAGRGGAAQERLRAARAKHEELLALQPTLDAQVADADAWTLLNEFFSPRGIPQLLIDAALPRINAILQELMKDTLPEWVVEFRTLRETKSGTEKEGLFIVVRDGAGERDIIRHSGGEQNLLRKVVRLGLGLFEAERHGGHHLIYCVDEPTIGLDSELVSRVLAVIYRLTKRFKQIIVVSHDPAITSGMPFTLECVRPDRNGPTMVRVVE